MDLEVSEAVEQPEAPEAAETSEALEGDVSEAEARRRSAILEVLAWRGLSLEGLEDGEGSLDVVKDNGKRTRVHYSRHGIKNMRKLEDYLSLLQEQMPAVERVILTVPSGKAGNAFINESILKGNYERLTARSGIAFEIWSNDKLDFACDASGQALKLQERYKLVTTVRDMKCLCKSLDMIDIGSQHLVAPTDELVMLVPDAYEGTIIEFKRAAPNCDFDPCPNLDKPEWRLLMPFDRPPSLERSLHQRKILVQEAEARAKTKEFLLKALETKEVFEKLWETMDETSNKHWLEYCKDVVPGFGEFLKEVSNDSLVVNTLRRIIREECDLRMPRGCGEEEGLSDMSYESEHGDASSPDLEEEHSDDSFERESEDDAVMVDAGDALVVAQPQSLVPVERSHALRLDFSLPAIDARLRARKCLPDAHSAQSIEDILTDSGKSAEEKHLKMLEAFPDVLMAVNVYDPRDNDWQTPLRSLCLRIRQSA